MTESLRYFAEQNARAMAHAIVNNPEVIGLIQAYSYFCMCINEKENFVTNPDGSILFKKNGAEVVVHDDERRLDPLVEVVERIVFELHYSKQV